MSQDKESKKGSLKAMSSQFPRKSQISELDLVADINTDEGLRTILTASREGDSAVAMAKKYLPKDNAELLQLALRLMKLEHHDEPKNLLRRKSLAAECFREILRRSDYFKKLTRKIKQFVKDKDEEKLWKGVFDAIPADAKAVIYSICELDSSAEAKKLRADDLMFFAKSFAVREMPSGLEQMVFAANAQNMAAATYSSGGKEEPRENYIKFLTGTVYTGMEKASRKTESPREKSPRESTEDSETDDTHSTASDSSEESPRKGANKKSTVQQEFEKVEKEGAELFREAGKHIKETNATLKEKPWDKKVSELMADLEAVGKKSVAELDEQTAKMEKLFAELDKTKEEGPKKAKGELTPPEGNSPTSSTHTTPRKGSSGQG
ncbi:MAG TPA: hypothetical protein VGV92_09705 [Gammaproteobacteria bacterium]|nr:hypothetical protein [Gammaproteobacteria bacterium]